MAVYAGDSSLDSVDVKKAFQEAKKNQKDTASIVVVKKPKNPKLAGVLSTIVPGAGQIYNGRWWKVPIIYGGGYLLYSGIVNRQLGKDFYHGMMVIKDRDGTDAEIITYVDGFKNKSKITNLSGATLSLYTEAQMKTYYDDYSSKLQNLYLFSVLLYGLNILDAVVDAHLKSFDVRDDLSFKIKPGIINSTGTFGGITPSIGFQFSFR
jgi:hypothetical protein